MQYDTSTEVYADRRTEKSSLQLIAPTGRTNVSKNADLDIIHNKIVQ